MEDNSLDSTFYDTVTRYQQAEALENAAAILEKWTDLAHLAEPIHRVRRALLTHDTLVTSSTSDTYRTH